MQFAGTLVQEQKSFRETLGMKSSNNKYLDIIMKFSSNNVIDGPSGLKTFVKIELIQNSSTYLSKTN